jgi:hypothetical protein
VQREVIKMEEMAYLLLPGQPYHYLAVRVEQGPILIILAEVG